MTLGLDLRDFEVDGLDGGVDASTHPGPGHVVRAKRLSGACAPVASRWCTADGTTESGETWTTDPFCSPETSEPGYLSLSNCWGTGARSGEDFCGARDEESCDGMVAAEIQPGSAACDDYDPARIELEPGATCSGRTSPSAACVAGSGRFRLIPRLRDDNDDDGDFHGVFDAIQTSGTGTMRRANHVTQIGSGPRPRQRPARPTRWTGSPLRPPGSPGGRRQRLDGDRRQPQLQQRRHSRLPAVHRRRDGLGRTLDDGGRYDVDL